MIEATQNIAALRGVSIVQCVTSMELGGLEHVVLKLAGRLKDRGLDCHICCLEERGSLAADAERQGIPVSALHLAQQGKLRTVRALTRLLRARRPNVIHSHNFQPYYFASLARVFGAADAHVHTRHGAFFKHHRAVWRYRLFRRWADSIVTVSAAGRLELARLTGLRESQLGVLANGVDLDRYQPGGAKGPIRRALNLPETPLAIVIAARLSPEKDLETLLRAFALVTQARPAVELWIVGDGQERPRLETLAGQLGVAPQTRFLGMRDDVSEILRAADVFALSSISEGLSIALIEAAACGLPIVATNVGGNAEIVDPLRTGRLVEPRSPPALAAALLEVLGNDSLRAALGRAARQHALDTFSLEHMVDQYIARYAHALPADARRPDQTRAR